jgi:hypothetical protein
LTRVSAIEQMWIQDRQHRKALELELEQARYEAYLAGRCYEAVDPANWRRIFPKSEARRPPADDLSLTNLQILICEIAVDAGEQRRVG